jgi:phage baseplate assembly protein V
MTLHEVASRFRNIMGIGRVSLADDTGDLQMLQVTEGAVGGGMKDRVTDKVPRITEFGFTSVPPLDAEVIVLYRAGDRSKPVVMATSHRPSRLKDLQPGDSALYDSAGSKVTITAAGILVEAAPGLPVIVRSDTKITLDAPNVECTGNFKADQLLTGDGTPVELGALRDAYNAHKHTGVATGPGTTGATDHTV